MLTMAPMMTGMLSQDGSRGFLTSATGSEVVVGDGVVVGAEAWAVHVMPSHHRQLCRSQGSEYQPAGKVGGGGTGLGGGGIEGGGGEVLTMLNLAQY